MIGVHDKGTAGDREVNVSALIACVCLYVHIYVLLCPIPRNVVTVIVKGFSKIFVITYRTAAWYSVECKLCLKHTFDDTSCELEKVCSEKIKQATEQIRCRAKIYFLMHI